MFSVIGSSFFRPKRVALVKIALENMYKKLFRLVWLMQSLKWHGVALYLVTHMFLSIYRASVQY